MGKMTMNLYLKSLKSRYLKGNRKLTLTSFVHPVVITIRMFKRGLLGTRDKRPGQRKRYDPKLLLPPLKFIWLATDQMCGARLLQHCRCGYHSTRLNMDWILI